jgi:hypothetical protein
VVGSRFGADLLLALDVHKLEMALQITEASGDDFAVAMVRFVLGTVLLNRDEPTERQNGLTMVEPERAIERLSSLKTDEPWVVREIFLLRLRALLARAHGDEKRYCELRDRYRVRSAELGFEGHMAWAEAMP